jgi:hypothetical protein
MLKGRLYEIPFTLVQLFKAPQNSWLVQIFPDLFGQNKSQEVVRKCLLPDRVACWGIERFSFLIFSFFNTLWFPHGSI